MCCHAREKVSSIVNSSIICLSPRLEPAIYEDIRVSFDNGSSFIGSSDDISFTTYGECPLNECPSDRGRCVFGRCICFPLYFGNKCSTRYIAPALKSIGDQQLLPGDGRYQQKIELASGNGNVTYSVITGPVGVTMKQNTVMWTAVSQSEPVLFSIKAMNGFSSSTVSWSVSVPFPYYGNITSVGKGDTAGSPATLDVRGRLVALVQDHDVTNVPARIWSVVLCFCLASFGCSYSCLLRLKQISRRRSTPSLISIPIESDDEGNFEKKIQISEIGSYTLVLFFLKHCFDLITFFFPVLEYSFECFIEPSSS